MIRKQRLCHDSLFKSMETKLAGVVHQKVAIIGLDYMLIPESK